ncbi:hypothetical protein [Rhizobacter sp. Root404]|nr:hypothetical protein [Rhizobacter sp. Root404]
MATCHRCNPPTFRPPETLPLFKAANRMNAYNTYLLMEQGK